MLQRVVLYVCVIILGALIVGQPVVFAISTNDLESITNNTPFYDDLADAKTAATSCQNTTNLVGSLNAEKAYNYFIGKGLTPVQAVAIMGNLTAESGINPKRVQGTQTPSGDRDTMVVDGVTGYGIAQWTDRGRQQGLADMAAAENKSVSDLGLQLDYLWKELNSNRKGSLDHLKQQTDVATATRDFMTQFEAPNADPAINHIDFRIQAAQGYLVKYGSTTPTPADPSAALTATPNSSGCGSSGVGGYVNPFRDVPNIAQAGIDAGVDYSGDGPVYAIGNGILLEADPHSGWEGGNSVTYKLTDGPAAGKVIYVAENCTVSPTLSAGQSVTSSTVLCVMHNQYPYIETGWAEESSSGATPLPYVDKCYKSTNPSLPKTSTAYGINFDALMHRLGAPKAGLLAPPITCTLPTGWPTW